MKIVLGLVAVLVVLALAAPWILSMGWVQTRVANAVSESLGTEVTIGDYDLGWFSGVEVDQLKIANPPGFPDEQPLFVLDSLRGDASFFDLLRGRFSIDGRASGMSLRVVQRADGTTNLQALGQKPAAERPAPDRPPAEKPPGETPSPDEPRTVEAKANVDLSNVSLDLEVRDSTIEIVHEQQGLLERMSNVQARISKGYGTPVVRLEFAADLERPAGEGEAGRIDVRVDAEPDPTRPVDMHITAIGLDLARYQPLVASFFQPGDVQAFSGVVSANTRVTGVPVERVSMDGTIAVAQPHFAGPLFRGMDIRSERFEMRPQLTATLPKGDEPIELDLSNVTANLGFMTVQGLPTETPAEGPARTGLRFDVDVARLASFGGPMPEMLRDSGTRLAGQVRAPLLSDFASVEPAEWLNLIGLDATLDVQKLAVVDLLLKGLKADVVLAEGALKLNTRSGTLDGGALTLTASADLGDLDDVPAQFELGLQNADVRANAIAALQYAVPMLAGLHQQLQAGQEVTFASKVNTSVAFAGPAMPKGSQTVLEWLDGWSGNGDLTLSEGRVNPAAAFGQLLALAGVQSKTLEFDRFATAFRLDDGFVETAEMKLAALGQEIGFQGRTSLAGAIDYTFDVKPLLAAHSDGQKVLRYLGDTPLGAELDGTLDDPVLSLPDLQKITESALEGVIQKEGTEILEDVLGGNKKDGEQGKPPAGVPDIGGILDRILNRKKQDGEK